MSLSPTREPGIVGPATLRWVPAQGLGAVAASPLAGPSSLWDKAKSGALCTNTQGDAAVMDGRSVGPAAGASPRSSRMGGVACGLLPPRLALLPSCFRRAIGNPSPAASAVPTGQDRTRQWRVGEPICGRRLHCRGLAALPRPRHRGLTFLQCCFSTCGAAGCGCREFAGSPGTGPHAWRSPFPPSLAEETPRGQGGPGCRSWCWVGATG